MPAIAPWKNSTLLINSAATMSPARTLDAAVGVNKTFDPEGFVNPGVARWVDRSGGIAAGFPSLSLSIRKPTKNSRIYKITSQLTIPRMAATSTSTNTGIEPAPTVAYSCQAKLEVLIPERATTAERAQLASQLMGALCTGINGSDDSPADATGTPIIACIVNLEAPY